MMRQIIYITFTLLGLIGCSPKEEIVEMQETPDFQKAFTFSESYSKELRKFIVDASKRFELILMEPSNPITVKNSQKFLLAFRDTEKKGPYCLTIDNVLKDNELLIRRYKDNCSNKEALLEFEQNIIQYLGDYEK